MVSTTNNAPQPVTTSVMPAGLVMDPPLFLDDPVTPGINFLQNIPILNLLPPIWFWFLPTIIGIPLVASVSKKYKKEREN